MSEKLLPCPFCGGEARTFEYDGANQATCGGKHIDCAGTDVVAPVAMWNRRTPAPEGEAWRTVPVEPTEAMLVNGREALMPTYRLLTCGPLIGVWKDMLAAAPVVPVGSDDTLPPISLDGPHKIGEHRQWLARQLLDSRQDDAEAYSTVIYSPAMTDIWRDDVVPVGVSREEIARIIEPEFFSIGRAGPGYETHRASAFRKADAIIAALRPTDTGGE
jgi:hypothetical protein